MLNPEILANIGMVFGLVTGVVYTITNTISLFQRKWISNLHIAIMAMGWFIFFAALTFPIGEIT